MRRLAEQVRRTGIVTKWTGGSSRLFSGNVPDSFFDDEKESKEVISDYKRARGAGGFQNLMKGFVKTTFSKNNMAIGNSFDSFESKRFGNDPIAEKRRQTINEREEYRLRTEEEQEAAAELEAAAEKKNEEIDIGPFAPMHEHESLFEPTDASSIPRPPETYNRSVQWDDGTYEAHPELKSFVKKTDESSQPYDKQGLVACPGKRQRQGKAGILRCHQIDLEELHYLDVVMLRRFLGPDSQIMGKKTTGLCSKCQRKVAGTVKRARKLGLLTHLGSFKLVDKDPSTSPETHNFHATFPHIKAVLSKTII